MQGLSMKRCPFCYDGCLTCGWTGWLLQRAYSLMAR